MSPTARTAAAGALLLVVLGAGCGSITHARTAPTAPPSTSTTSTTIGPDRVQIVENVFENISTAVDKLPQASTDPTYFQVKDAAGPLATACAAGLHELDSVTWPAKSTNDEAVLYASLQTLQSVIDGDADAFRDQFVPDLNQVTTTTKALLDDLGSPLGS